MMKKNVVGIICSLLIFICLAVHYASDALTVRSGIRLLLPVSVEDVKTDAFSSIVRIRYNNFVPVEELTEEKGTLIVRRFNDGRVAFVSFSSGRKLQPSEVLLKYRFHKPSSSEKDSYRFGIRFASSEMRFSAEQKFYPAAVRYAVVFVDAKGKAALTGLADAAGQPLVSAYFLKTFRISKNRHNK